MIAKQNRAKAPIPVSSRRQQEVARHWKLLSLDGHVGSISALACASTCRRAQSQNGVVSFGVFLTQKESLPVMWGLFTSAWGPLARVVNGELPVFGRFLRILVHFHETTVSSAVIMDNVNISKLSVPSWSELLWKRICVAVNIVLQSNF